MNDTNQTYKHPDPQSDYEEGEIVDPSKLTPQPMQQLQFSTTQQHQWAAQNQPNFNPNSFVEITPKLKVSGSQRSRQNEATTVSRLNTTQFSQVQPIEEESHDGSTEQQPFDPNVIGNEDSQVNEHTANGVDQQMEYIERQNTSASYQRADFNQVQTQVFNYQGQPLDNHNQYQRRNSLPTTYQPPHPDEEFKEEGDRPRPKVKQRHPEMLDVAIGFHQDATGAIVNHLPTNELAQLMRSKQDIYSILTTQGQFYLPPYQECTIEFLRDLFSGRKRVLLNHEVKMISVPRLSELSAKRLLHEAQTDFDILMHLPETRNFNKPMNRQFLFNVINTIKPEFFSQNIHECLRKRKEQAATKEKKYIEITTDIYNLLSNSITLSTNQRGRALHLLNVGTKKRKRPQYQDRQHQLPKDLSTFESVEVSAFSTSPTGNKRRKINSSARTNSGNKTISSSGGKSSARNGGERSMIQPQHQRVQQQ